MNHSRYGATYDTDGFLKAHGWKI
ncbi:hypothetical protein TRIP_B200483 [uncultured Desulfatiglans sp.]|nr:hypothetical protein TRIP_B200483 [uncultured Desulfatiglans sp.]